MDLQRRDNEKLAWIKRKSIKLPKSNGLGKYRRPSLSAASIYKGMDTKQCRLSERPVDEPSKPLTSSAATVALSTASDYFNALDGLWESGNRFFFSTHYWIGLPSELFGSGKRRYVSSNSTSAHY